MVRVVLFDVGGVLVELGGLDRLLGWLDHRMSAEEFLRQWLMSPSVRAFETGRSSPMEFAHGVLGELELAQDPQGFLDAFATWPTRAYPGALELVARVPPHYRRALLSNSNALHWRRVTDEMGLGALFPHQFVSHLTGKIKPDADAFEHVLEALACRADEVLFLDDNAINVEAARALGLQAAQTRGVDEAERALVSAGIVAPRS